jgi:GTP pyrophosphokinase
MPTVKLQQVNEEQERKEILLKYRQLLKVSRTRLWRGDRKQIRLAFEMALEAHKDMRRKSGEPYIFHPIEVAKIVADEIGLGSTSVICALLHDVVEDTETTLQDIQVEFGKHVSEIIDGLTKISAVFDVSGGSIQAENVKKILFTLAKDVRVILIKLSDRLHNMRTMDAMPKNKQIKIASETLYLYAPLAHRLGLYAIKSELEDLAMKYTEQKTYKAINKKLTDSKEARESYIEDFLKPIKRSLQKGKIKFDVTGRSKSIYSIWNKMKKQGVPFEEVYDKFAIRIIIDSPQDKEKADCWRAYSIVTDHYHPNPDRLRDWISNPKANGYEALHTTVMGPEGQWVEVQIRTKRMNEIAEKGFAAHWKYKEDAPAEESALDDWLKGIRELLEDNDKNTYDFLDEFQLNFFTDEIYLFTPKGDLKVLPTNSTVLDYAFEIHTDVGVNCIGAKVNHKIVPLSHQLSNGDQVEVLTSKKQQPNEAWLDQVITPKAKTKIKDALKKERNKIVKQGQKMVEGALKKRKITLNAPNLTALIQYFQFSSPIDLYYSAGIGNINLEDLNGISTNRGSIILASRKSKGTKGDHVEKAIKNTLLRNANLLVFGENSDQIDYNMATCCNPIPGDDVNGFVNKHGEIEIHKANCATSIKLISKYGYKIVKTKWSKEHKIAFLTGLKITGLDDVGIMHKITEVISGKQKVNIQSITIDSHDGIFEGTINVYVDDTQHLKGLMKELERVKEILSVNRLDETELDS